MEPVAACLAQQPGVIAYSGQCVHGNGLASERGDAGPRRIRADGFLRRRDGDRMAEVFEVARSFAKRGTS